MPREVVMTAAWNGRIFDAQVNEDQPFEILCLVAESVAQRR